MQGQFSGWWLSDEDGRIDSPFINPEEWEQRLRAAGFEGCHSVTLDNDQPYTYNANIIARPALDSAPPRRITLLQGPGIYPLVNEVEELLLAQGKEVEYCEWGCEPPADQDLISFIDLGEKPLLQDLTEEDLAHFLDLVNTLQASTVLWLMRSAQIRCSDPHAAQILGMARTIRSELAMSFATLELEKLDSSSAEAVLGVLNKLQKSREEITELDPDMEYIWANGALHVSRFHWVPVEKSLSETGPVHDTKCLTIGTPGLLRTLHWAGQPLSSPTPDEVYIKVSVVGLNFKDLMIAMGVIPGGETITDGSSPLGLEGCGYVTKVGADVTNVAVGDRVLWVGCESVGMATTIRRSASLCIKVPGQLSDEEAATIPVVYATVLMFLVEKWKLEKGQSILIHSAAGGK